MRDVIVMRAIHIAAVVIWIGGVSIVTTVLLPALRHGDFGSDPLGALRIFERRFIWQARTCVVLVGLSGFYMAWRLALWDRFQRGAFWWMHAMVLVWLAFSVVLFIAEPLMTRRRRQCAEVPSSSQMAAPAQPAAVRDRPPQLPPVRIHPEMSSGTSESGTPLVVAAEVLQTLARLQRAHWLLLALSIVTVMAAVAGSHGWTFR